MAYTAINSENAADFAEGSVVEFNYGPMYGTERGVVTGFETSQFGTQLVAETENGERKTISGFSTVGIGVYLVEKATGNVDKTSPWYMAA